MVICDESDCLDKRKQLQPLRVASCFQPDLSEGTKILTEWRSGIYCCTARHAEEAIRLYSDDCTVCCLWCRLSILYLHTASIIRRIKLVGTPSHIYLVGTISDTRGQIRYRPNPQHAILPLCNCGVCQCMALASSITQRASLSYHKTVIYTVSGILFQLSGLEQTDDWLPFICFIADSPTFPCHQLHHLL